ncbi:Ankyrin repeat family protein [Forsythia ovata]|uniref:Ankyrin repeat family protein n=1 Tax=Forsythia ovata TaxID=205694 RepID=A0ABD1QGF5_9LAMI
MARRNGRRRRANERRRQMNTCESEPELGSDDLSELSREDTYPTLDTHIYRSNPLVVEGQVLQQQNMDSQVEIKVEDPISNVNAQHMIVHQIYFSPSSGALCIFNTFEWSPQTSSGKGKVNTLRLGPFLYRAALRGDWKAAKTALSLDRTIACIEITERGDRTLHIAAAAKQTAFVHNLVEHLNTNDLELEDKHGNTAFCFAAVSGVVEIAKVMYEKNKNLPTIRSGIGQTPLEMAILLGNREMVEYLYPITPLKNLNSEDYMGILVATIHTDMYDFKRIYSSLQMRRQASQLVKGLWEQILKLPDSEILQLIQETQIFHDAAKIGNIEFLTLLTHSYPDLMWKVDSNGCSIFHVAVINRQEKVFSLIYHIGAVKDLITLYTDNEGNNILHLAGKLAPPSRLNIVSGAALQMQRELLWFKEVKKIVPYSLLEMKNGDHKTPSELFSKKHKRLREDGEEWMKETATSCMVVATLIATVAFAAAFTAWWE